MKPEWKRLAGEMLERHSEMLGDAGCNDWPWPVDWTQADREALVRAMVADNVRANRTVLTAEDEADIAMWSNPAREFGPPDSWVAAFLGKLLREGYP